MVQTVFILGLAIVLGYVTLLIADKYKISQVLILMLFGFLIGPILGVVNMGDGSVMREVYPFMATIALVILLFDGGLSFNIFNVFKTITKSTIYTFAVFILTVLFSLSLILLWGLDWLQALILGAALGGTSSAIVIAMIEKTSASDDTKSLLKIESVITDSLVIIIVFILIAASKTAQMSVGGVVNMLFGTFSISIVLGALSAIAWNFVLQNVIKKELDYMLTIGALFILYPVIEALGGNGGLAVFIFGLTFGNQKNIPSTFLSVARHEVEAKIKGFQEEVTFFTRTFFFVYIGMLFPLESLNLGVIGISVFLVGVCLLARFICTTFLLNNNGEEKYEKDLIITMLPRGLATAVVIGLLIENSVEIKDLEIIAFLVIFLTNFIATVSIYMYQRRPKLDKLIDEAEGEVEKEEMEKAEVGEVHQEKAVEHVHKKKK